MGDWGTQRPSQPKLFQCSRENPSLEVGVQETKVFKEALKGPQPAMCRSFSDVDSRPHLVTTPFSTTHSWRNYLFGEGGQWGGETHV